MMGITFIVTSTYLYIGEPEVIDGESKTQVCCALRKASTRRLEPNSDAYGKCCARRPSVAGGTVPSDRPVAPERRFRQVPVLYRVWSDYFVASTVDGEMTFAEGSAGLVWEAFSIPRTVDGAVATVARWADASPDHVETAVRAFVDELIELGLLEPS